MQDKWIISDPNILRGKPVIVGTRISVEWIVRQIVDGVSIFDLLDEYPQLSYEAVLAAIAWDSDRRGGRYLPVHWGHWRELKF